MSTPDTTNHHLARALQAAARELREHQNEYQHRTPPEVLRMIEHAARLPMVGQLGFQPDTPPPTRLHLQGDGWSEGLPIVSLEREGDTLRVVAAPQINRPAAFDPQVVGPPIVVGPTRVEILRRGEWKRREAAENHVRAAAASVVAELGAACCCGLKLPGRVARAVRDLAWRLATLKAVRK